MTIGAIFFSIAILVVVGLYLARPLLQPPHTRKEQMSPYENLLSQKETILYQIQSLDLDYETGKISESEYQEQREVLMVEAKTIMIQLDEFEMSVDDAISSLENAFEPESISSLDQDIETAIAIRRHEKLQSLEDPEQMESTAALISSRNGGANFCVQCGEPIDKGDKFCAHCGYAVKQSQNA